MSCYSRLQARRAQTTTLAITKRRSTVSTRKFIKIYCWSSVDHRFSSSSSSFVSPQNSNNNSIKRERETSELYGEDSYDYSDEDEYEPAKRMKEA